MEAALREMYRVSKPGGCIGVTFFGKTPPPFNPGYPLLFQQFLAYQVRVRTSQPSAYAPGEVEALLNRSGFHSIEAHSETYDVIYASMEDWWTFLISTGTRAFIMGMNEEMRGRFKDEYFTKLRPMLSQDGLHISLAVIYALAKR